MKFDWLNTRFGIDFVAIGLVAAIFVIPDIMFQDIWFLATGVWLKFHLQVLYYLLAAVAAVFSAGNFFVFRPGLPKFVTVVLAISFGSYVVQPFVPLHGNPRQTLLCIARILGFSTLLLLAWRHLLDLKAERDAW